MSATGKADITRLISPAEIQNGSTIFLAGPIPEHRWHMAAEFIYRATATLQNNYYYRVKLFPMKAGD